MICRCFQYCISMQSLLGECKTSTLPPELQDLVASLGKGPCAWAPVCSFLLGSVVPQTGFVDLVCKSITHTVEYFQINFIDAHE